MRSFTIYRPYDMHPIKVNQMLREAGFDLSGKVKIVRLEVPSENKVIFKQEETSPHFNIQALKEAKERMMRDVISTNSAYVNAPYTITEETIVYNKNLKTQVGWHPIKEKEPNQPFLFYKELNNKPE